MADGRTGGDPTPFIPAVMTRSEVRNSVLRGVLKKTAEREPTEDEEDEAEEAEMLREREDRTAPASSSSSSSGVVVVAPAAAVDVDVDVVAVATGASLGIPPGVERRRMDSGARRLRN